MGLRVDHAGPRLRAVPGIEVANACGRRVRQDRLRQVVRTFPIPRVADARSDITVAPLEDDGQTEGGGFGALEQPARGVPANERELSSRG